MLQMQKTQNPPSAGAIPAVTGWEMGWTPFTDTLYLIFYFLLTFRWNIQSTHTTHTGTFAPLGVNTGFLKHGQQHSSNVFTVMFWLMMPIKAFCLTLCLPVLRSSDGPILGSANKYNRTSACLNGKRKSIVVEQTPISSTRNMLRVQSASCYYGNNEDFL